MTNLSRKSRYGLRAVWRLGRDYGRGPVTAAEIAESESIPRKFLEVILLQLQKAGVVDSWRGKNGGYRLAVPPARLTVGAILRAIEGPQTLAPCVSDTGPRQCPECPLLKPCETRAILLKMKAALGGVLDETTIEDVNLRRDPHESFAYEI
ncbi:MAG: Rrf2 family transcriptional regulator [Acidobacteria bacterium]|nr:Rrf2 family transcriptional regulator [Acidobacteriota bacterium]